MFYFRNSIIDISTPINIQNENELIQPQQQEDKISNIEFIPQVFILIKKFNLKKKRLLFILANLRYSN